MNDRFKFRFWNNMQKCYSQDDHYIDEDGQLNTSGKYIVEQCTGLKDKNGKLIYEGDIVVDEFGEKMLVCWDSKYLQFCFQQDNGWYVRTNSEIEVIGNIHENADLIKVGGK